MRFAALTALLLLVATRAPAGEARISWDACGADGPRDKTFACDTETGDDLLHVSFTAPDASPIQSIAVQLDFIVYSPVCDYPSWWSLLYPGACRGSAVSLSADFSGDPGCADWSGGTAAASFTSVGGDCAHTGYTYTRYRFASASATPLALEAGRTYGALRLDLSHRGTVGPGSCAGCSAGFVIRLLSLTLNGPAGPRALVTPGPGPEDPLLYVYWQGGTSGLGPPTAARRSTWGAIKSLYR
jgi:hypothetical protein